MSKKVIVIENSVKYKYLINNSNFTDMSQPIFQAPLSVINGKQYAEKSEINYLGLESVVNLPIQVVKKIENILLVCFLFFILIFIILTLTYLLHSPKSPSAIMFHHLL